MMAQLMKVSAHQAGIALVALMSLLGIIACTLLRVPVPDVLNTALTAALGAQFGLTLPSRPGDKP